MKYVVVTWEDVSKSTNIDDFNDKSNIDKMLEKVVTIGCLHKETEKTLMLVQEFNYDGTPRDFVFIPRSLMVKTNEIKNIRHVPPLIVKASKKKGEKRKKCK